MVVSLAGSADRHGQSTSKYLLLGAVGEVDEVTARGFLCGGATFQ